MAAKRLKTAAKQRTQRAPQKAVSRRATPRSRARLTPSASAPSRRRPGKPAPGKEPLPPPKAPPEFPEPGNIRPATEPAVVAAPEPVVEEERTRSSYDGDTAIKLYLREIGKVPLLTPQSPCTPVPPEFYDIGELDGDTRAQTYASLHRLASTG